MKVLSLSGVRRLDLGRMTMKCTGSMVLGAADLVLWSNIRGKEGSQLKLI